ncbi:unnamed protein product [Arctogadus glacialis]
MAEYTQKGILTAVLFFSAITLRDIYVGRSQTQQQGPQASESLGMASDSLPDAGTVKPGKPSLYTGPVLKFQYCKVYQEYSRAISQLYPDIRIEGENYPPTPTNRYLGNFFSYFKLLAITLVVSGQNPFPILGLATPRAWVWSQENKIFSCLMAFFLSNMLETHFLSTGAFEIMLNDVPIWSKLQSGYVPNVQEVFQILDNHIKMNQVDQMNFSSP